TRAAPFDPLLVERAGTGEQRNRCPVEIRMRIELDCGLKNRLKRYLHGLQDGLARENLNDGRGPLTAARPYPIRSKAFESACEQVVHASPCPDPLGQSHHRIPQAIVAVEPPEPLSSGQCAVRERKADIEGLPIGLNSGRFRNPAWHARKGPMAKGEFYSVPTGFPTTVIDTAR